MPKASMHSVQWNIEHIYQLEHAVKEDPSLENYVQFLFICWYLVMEKGCISHEISDEFLMEKLTIYYGRGQTLFFHNPRFNFFLGWMLNIAHWYFGIKDADLGEKLLLKAHSLDNDNPLYKWACAEYLGLPAAEVKRLAGAIDRSEFSGLNHMIEDYFMELVTHVANS